MYPLPGAGRDGVIAIYAALEMYRRMLENGVKKALQCVCLYQNTEFHRAVERIWGRKPIAVVFSASNV
jgi:hypothetical protein